MIHCERCGRVFEKQAHLDVHPCPDVVGQKTARAIRAQFDPAQLHIDEF